MAMLTTSSTDTDTDTATADIHGRFEALIAKQYDHTAHYCNASTALSNAWLQQQNEHTTKGQQQQHLSQAVTDLQEATARVQTDYQNLQALQLLLAASTNSQVATRPLPISTNGSTDSSQGTLRPIRQRRQQHNHHWQVLAEEHVRRTARILQSLAHANGGGRSSASVPLSPAAAAPANALVALATLRASIAQLQAALAAAGSASE
jgi:hypothetical protein